MKTKAIFLFLILIPSILFAHNEKVIRIRDVFTNILKTNGIEKVNSMDLIKDLSSKSITFLKIKEKSTLMKNGAEIVHEQFQQYYNGIQVEGGQCVVHSINNRVISVNGNYIKIDSIKCAPLLDDTKALILCLKYTNANNHQYNYYLDNLDKDTISKKDIPKKELVITTDGNNFSKVSYKYHIVTLKPIHAINIYLDAINGDLIKSVSLLADATPGQADTKYSGRQNINTSYSSLGYFLCDNTDPSNYVFNSQRTFSLPSIKFYDNDNNWDAIEWNNTLLDNIALDVYWGCTKVQDFLNEIIGINSYNNSNGILKSYVHYGDNYQNASSVISEPIMMFGDGDKMNTGPWGSLDIVAHEIGHKVIYNAINTIGLSDGALSEGFADIFAACAENYIAPQKETWNFAEDICMTSSFERSFSNPKSAGRNGMQYADTYGGLFWDGNIYQKSTVLSHWFYIFIEGKVGINDFGYNYNITGIGDINVGALIIYNILNNYIMPNSSFQDVKEQSIEYIQNTYGEISNESLVAMQAWHAVGVPGECSVSIENKTINYLSEYSNLDIGDCSLNFNNVLIVSGCNTIYSAGQVTINNDFEIQLGATFEIK